MAAPVLPVEQIQVPAGPSPVTAEQRYWRSFKPAQTETSAKLSPVTHISQSASAFGVASELFAVTSGPRITLYNARTLRVYRQIQRFALSEVAHSAETRPKDSRLVVAGGESGTVQVFDINSRAILKTWRESKQAIWRTTWSAVDSTKLVSCGDDRSIRLWDLTESQSIWRAEAAHDDYIRDGSFLRGQNSNLFASAAYDGVVKLWDTRKPPEQRAVLSFAHSSPLERLLVLPVQNQIATSASNVVSILDIVAAKPMAFLRSHEKTVTSLCLANRNTRLLSGGLDGHVKIYDVSDWKVVANLKYSSPVLSLAVVSAHEKSTSPSNEGATTARDVQHIVAGLQSGSLSIRTRLAGAARRFHREKETEMKALSAGGATLAAYDLTRAKLETRRRIRQNQGNRAKMRGLKHAGEDADLQIEGNTPRHDGKKKLKDWDRALHEAEYSRALDLALGSWQISSDSNNQNTTTELMGYDYKKVTDILTVLTALIHRCALRTALKGRDEVTIQPLLRFLIKHLSDSRHINLIIEVAVLVLDLYAEHFGNSPVVDNLVARLHEKVRREVEEAQSARATCGMLECIATDVCD